MAEVIRYGKPGPILDLGAGLGLFVELGLTWGLDIIGLEGSEHAVEVASARYPGIDIRVHDLGEPLPFEDGMMANIVLNQVIEHLDYWRQRKVLSDIFRILAPGGRLFITSPSRKNRIERQDPTHINMLLPSELRQQVESEGFMVVSEPNYGFFLGGSGSRVIGFLADMLLRLFPHDLFSATANIIGEKPCQQAVHAQKNVV